MPRHLESWWLRCPGCGRLLRSRVRSSREAVRVYDVELLGRPETRRRVEVPWTEEDGTRMRRWLVWSTFLTLGLLAALYWAARLLSG